MFSAVSVFCISIATQCALGVSIPLKKTTPYDFFLEPPLKSANCLNPSPFLGTPPPPLKYDFSVHPHNNFFHP